MQCMKRCRGVLAGLVAAGVVTAVGCSGPTATVVVRYTVPPQKELPSHVRTVAVLDAQTNDPAEAKWSELAAGLITDLLQRAADRGYPIRVADRQSVKQILAEKDMALAGIVEGNAAVTAARLLGVDALIGSDILIKVEKHRGKERTISALDVIAWSHGGGGSIRTEEVEKVARNITVQCKFKMVDAGTGETIFYQAGDPVRKTDRTAPSPLFGSSRTEADMPMRDQIIGELIEREARRFVSRFAPTDMREVITVRSSGNRDCQRGVRFLESGDDEEALAAFRRALQENPEDAWAAFGAGVACERLGRLEEAGEYYSRAVSLGDDDEFVRARKRIRFRQHLAARAEGTVN